MRVILDATPLLGRRTGIGRYVRELVGALRAGSPVADLDLGLSTWTWRGGRLTDLPPGTHQVGRPVPARVLQSAWRRIDVPTAEQLYGALDVFHGTNFVSAPTRRAAEVLTVHDLTFLDLPTTVAPASLAYRDLVPRALDRGAHVVTPTLHVAEAVRARYGLPADRVTATPLGVDASWFGPQGPSPVPHDDYVVFVGSLDPRKNLPRLLEAHRELRAQDPGTPDLVLAGPAGREPGIADAPGVHVAGWLDDASLRALVAGARALVLPSLDEGFGLPVLEALAAGRPVVAADIPSLREVGGDQVELADPTDTASIAAAVARAVAADDDAAARDARRARASLYTWARCARATLAVYERAAAS
ncbi:glycosyltransferase family 4 protein [Cellulomonas sp. Sa3CUA2]|uniref:Glycosyltransferase family 4 protein n=1 Tax=Cellulomonas avistercoris TaxID=2762242 RepID=A0ABR8QIN7_9CELL|nr:glycosyltransferase family 1 protein [Cellulomonas avistercoris]MBD7920206.1 glycosyltransferase family 4 protein [Cellulomonas avistercoris]